MKNLFFNLKLHLFLFWRSRPIFNVIIGFPTQKKYKGANFHEDWPYRTQAMKISFDTENSEWQIFKKGPKITQFQKSISQKQFRVR